jgi:flagellar biosynthetic protein FliP
MKRHGTAGPQQAWLFALIQIVVLVALSAFFGKAQAQEAEGAGAPAMTPPNTERVRDAEPASEVAPLLKREAGPQLAPPAAPTAAAASAQAQPSTSAQSRSAVAHQSTTASSLRAKPANLGTSTSGTNTAITPATETAQALRIVLGLTVLAVLPALLVCLTSFLRIIVVLSMLRHAIGMNETPPNTVLIGLALFLTLFTMSPVLQKVNQDAFEPFMAGKLTMEDGYGKGVAPLREFMVRQTREADLALMVELSKAPTPKSMDDISNVQLIPSFMLSELRAAFQIGFVIFLPFLLIDLIVSSILMALGMMMMPPTTIALPLKILMFILVDGWSLVLKALVGSFH